jgi:serine/threonine protein kinase
MSLTPGTRLGIYEVTAKIGEGGMGEVYQARDTTLDRDVALKVLPEAFTADPDRLARFQREAKVLASLNHPNIGSIYGLEAAGNTQALVLELIEGPTLADRIAEGPIPVDEALAIAKQIAEALEAAHEQDIVHRDLKPANVKVKADGTVKVLDFGLAKAVASDTSGGSSTTSATISLTASATQMGMVIGTAAYMAPEQAKGQVVDHRADLWAFGVVLLEMLTGQQVFRGPTVSESLARVLERRPDLDALPSDLPPMVRRLLRRCLTKDRRGRLQHAGDARVDLTEAVTDLGSDAIVVPGAPRPGRHRVWQMSAFIVMAVVTAYVAGRWTGELESSSDEFRRFALPLDMEQRSFSAGSPRSFGISPAGDVVVFVVDPNRGDPLYRRDLDSVDTVAIPGTERGEAPFFSPDGRWVGFYVTTEATLKRVSLSGGVPEPITTMADSQGRHGYPHHLPVGNRLLFTIDDVAGDLPMIAAVSVDGGDPVELGIRGREPRYLSVGSAGYLVYGQVEGLVAVPFDPETLVVGGVPVSVLAPVQIGNTAVHATFTTDGAAVFLEPTIEEQLRPMWVVRDGSSSFVRGVEPGFYREVSLSVDGRLVALSGVDVPLRIQNLDTDELFDVDSRGAIYSRWAPDGTAVAFSSNRTGRFQMYTADISGSGGAVPLTETDKATLVGSWSRDGATVFFYDVDPQTGRDIYAYDLDDGRATPLLVTAADERAPMVSPDGSFLAYLSDASGRFEVYVSSLPGLEVTRQVSRDGGTEPNWSAAGDELFYRSDAGAMVAVPFRSAPEMSIGRPQELFRDEFLREQFGNTSYAVTPDGRFMMLSAGEASAGGVQLQVALGFADELHRLVSEQQ